MPELPEVEVTRRHLASWLVGGRVVRAFARGLVGRTVQRVERHGKWLRVELDAGPLVFSHLGMTGKWVQREAADPAQRWERGRIDVVHRGEVTSARYVDARKLGRLVAVAEDLPAWRALGPDPLVDGLEARVLAEALSRRRRAVKEALMDQTLVAGIGNIVATEALWRARLDPRSRTDLLTPVHARVLARALRAVLKESILRQTKELQYVHDAGGKNPFRVYGRAGSPCPRCRTTLARTVLAGRGTTWCPGCQERLVGRARGRAKRAAKAEA